MFHDPISSAISVVLILLALAAVVFIVKRFMEGNRPSSSMRSSHGRWSDGDVPDTQRADFADRYTPPRGNGAAGGGF